jgi:hypothetical protein
MVGLTTPSWRIATPFIRGRRPSHRHRCGDFVGLRTLA